MRTHSVISVSLLLGTHVARALNIAVNRSATRPTPFVPLPLPASDATDAYAYAWLVDTDEERRLTALLGLEHESDFHELDFLGFYVSAPPDPCPRCGKETEFIDWVYTALERGIHSREWIIASLKAGRNSKKGPHDVYCSRCGHLTAFQDLSGEEGGMSDIENATPYDRTTKTFGRFPLEYGHVLSKPEEL